MKRSKLLIIFATLFFTANIYADAILLTGEDDVESILEKHRDQRVTVVLESGTELTGKIAAVNDEALHLMGLSGKEFYDAVVSTDAIEAVVIRVRNQ